MLSLFLPEVLFLLMPLGLSLSPGVLVYARTERRHRNAWRRLALPAGPRNARPPYRSLEPTPVRWTRAPLLLRGAAATSLNFAWWLLTGGLLTAALLFMGRGPTAPLAVLTVSGFAVAAMAWRNGTRLLQCDRPAIAPRGGHLFGLGVTSVLFALGLVAGGGDWGGPLGIVVVVTALQTAIVALAARRHAAILAASALEKRQGEPSEHSSTWCSSAPAKTATFPAAAPGRAPAPKRSTTQVSTG
jgi:hypothetical protein